MTPLFVSIVGDNEIQSVGIAATENELRNLIASQSSRWLAISAQGLLEPQSVLAVCRTANQCGLPMAIAPHTEGTQWSWLAANVTSMLATFVLPPEQHATVLLRSDRLGIHDSLRSVSHPIWDLTIRIALEGRLVADHSPNHPQSCDDEAALPPELAELPDLTPSRPGNHLNWLRSHLESTPLSRFVGIAAAQTEITALKAGLLQLHDFLDESHRCSQQIEQDGQDRNGDYWHAIMHRREPDYANSKYWFRSVGQHPIFRRLAKVVHIALMESGDSDAGRWGERFGLPSDWDPFAFVDFCQAAVRRGDSAAARTARRIQRAEQLLLLAHTFAAAVGQH